MGPVNFAREIRRILAKMTLKVNVMWDVLNIINVMLDR